MRRVSASIFASVSERYFSNSWSGTIATDEPAPASQRDERVSREPVGRVEEAAKSDNGAAESLVDHPMVSDFSPKPGKNELRVVFGWSPLPFSTMEGENEPRVFWTILIPKHCSIIKSKIAKKKI